MFHKFQHFCALPCSPWDIAELLQEDTLIIRTLVHGPSVHIASQDNVLMRAVQHDPKSVKTVICWYSHASPYCLVVCNDKILTKMFSNWSVAKEENVTPDWSCNWWHKTINRIHYSCVQGWMVVGLYGVVVHCKSRW